MAVQQLKRTGSKKHEFIIFVHLFAVLGKHFFSEFELENSPYKFSSWDNKLVKCEKFSILKKRLTNVKSLVCCRNYFLCLFCLLKRNV